MSHNRIFPYQSGFTPDWAGRPAGLVEKERELWQWFRVSRGTVFDMFWFNVRLDGTPAQEKRPLGRANLVDGKWRRLWVELTAKRADVIGLSDGAYSVIELRSDIVPSTIGELSIYNDLVHSEFPDLNLSPGIIVGSLFLLIVSIDYILVLKSELCREPVLL